MAESEPRGGPMHRWLLETGDALGVDPDAMDVELLLDMARDVAHGVARPAAPLTAYLIGYAVARGGGDHDALEQAVRDVTARAVEWRKEDA